MSGRTRHKLKVVEAVGGDMVFTPERLIAIVNEAQTDDDSFCGNGDCDKLLLPNFSPESAQHYFVGRAGRTLVKCPKCGATSLVSDNII